MVKRSESHIKSIQATGISAAALTRQTQRPAPDFCRYTEEHDPPVIVREVFEKEGLRMIKHIGIVLIILFLPSLNLSAEPSSALDYFAKEPASLFDLGMYRLNENLKDVSYHPESVERKLIISAHYNSYDRRIRIAAGDGFAKNGARNFDQAKIWCREAIRTIRLKFGIDSDSGTTLNLDKSSNLYIYFTHFDHRDDDKIKAMGRDLDSMTEIVVSIGIAGTKDYEYCSGPLASKEIYFKDMKLDVHK